MTLREQIESYKRAGAVASASPQCALRKKDCRCGGIGLLLRVEGASVRGEVCSCVQSCPACFGSNRIEMEGSARYCRTPSPKQIVMAVNGAGIPGRYLRATLETFANQSGNCSDVLGKVKQWYQSFRIQGGPGLIISGPVGVGKTYILAALARRFALRGQSVKYIDFHRLLSVIRSAYSDKISEESILAPLIEADILIIDELGKGRNNDWEQEKLDQIVMGRYNQNKVIVASTNYQLKSPTDRQNMFNIDLEQEVNPRAASSFNPDVFDSLESRVGQRIFSRLFETSLMLELKGDDFRRMGRRPGGQEVEVGR